MDSALWGLLGTAIGALASIATTWLASLSSYKLQQNKSREERDERANAFQRQTLLDLQEAIHDALRQICRANHEDVMASRANGGWQKTMLPDEISEGVRVAFRRVTILVERVSNDSLRARVKALMSEGTLVVHSKSEIEANAHYVNTMASVESVFEEIGVVLRQHY